MTREPRAFTLIEVVLALGVLAGTVTALLGLLAVWQRQSTEAEERARAGEAATAAGVSIGRGDFDRVVSRIVAPGEAASEEQRLYLSRDLVRAGWSADMAREERFYAVSFERLTDISAPGGEAGAGYVAVTFRVEWPASLLDPLARADVAVLRCNHVLLR